MYDVRKTNGVHIHYQMWYIVTYICNLIMVMIVKQKKKNIIQLVPAEAIKK